MEEVGVCMYGSVGGEREVEAKGEQVERERARDSGTSSGFHFHPRMSKISWFFFFNLLSAWKLKQATAFLALVELLGPTSTLWIIFGIARFFPFSISTSFTTLQFTNA